MYVHRKIDTPVQVPTALRRSSLINNRFAMVVLENKSSGAASSVWDSGHENVWRRLVYSEEVDACRCLRWFVIH